MFLPTKAHTKEIVDGQHKIRLGNRVPTNAVNLAYMHVPDINSMENVLITDLSNTILENTRNADPINVTMYPDTSLVLQMEDGQIELPTEDVLITNVFKNGVPLYYSHRLAYKHYDQKGPDDYGIYNREGISIVDRNGQPITRPYQIQLIADPNHFNLYHVMIYTSFKDKESDTYQVVYNAIDVKEDGIQVTMTGHRESLNLKRAFDRIYSVQEITDLIANKEILPSYYQANGTKPGHSKFYVPIPRIKDTREYQKFRYQVAAEVETESDRYVYTTPWYSNSLLNPNYLSAVERAAYENGYKQITDKTAEAIMQPYIPYEYKIDKYTTIRYFVNIDNPKVEEFLRTDGSSPVYVTTTFGDETNALSLPMDAKVIPSPVSVSSEVSFRARPLMAREDERAYITFIMDNSESMGVNDPEKTLRLQMMESILYSVRHYYSKNMMNGLSFNHLIFPIREEFRVGDIDLVDEYAKSVTDNDVTTPVPAIDRAFELLDPIVDVDTTYDIAFNNRKFLILITDGEFSSLEEIEQKMQESQAKNIRMSLICFNNVPALKQIAKKYNALCIDASSPRLMMELRYLFFNMAGLYDVVDLGIKIPFTMDPQDNDMMLKKIDGTTFNFPQDILDHKYRYGVEAVLDDDPWIPEISMYFQEITTNEIMGSYNGANIVTLESLFKYSGYTINLHSEAWQYYYAPKFSIRYNDSQKIMVLPPRQRENDFSWYPRIKNGRFDRKILDQLNQPIYNYSIPEYYRQQFLEGEGIPYKAIKRERPEVLNQSQIRVSCTPMSINFDGVNVTNVTVMVNDSPIRIKSWMSFDGIIEVDGTVTKNDDIYVDYVYEEEAFEYRGYYNADDDCFWSLDLNPSKGHFITIRDTLDGEIKEVPSFSLINKVIYIYLNPSTKMKATPSGELRLDEMIHSSTLFHSFERIQDPNAVLLAEIRVRPNSNQTNIELVDSRVRGGGLKKTITKAIMKEFEEESIFYWDIGHWDGEPYPENGIINIRITRSVLKEYGGSFTRPEIEEKLEKHLGYGILPIIEFVDDPDAFLQIPENLVVKVIDIDDQSTETEKPTFSLMWEE